MDEVEELCSRIAIVDHGKVIALGSLEELLNQANMKQRIHFVLATDNKLTDEQKKALDEKFSQVSVESQNVIVPVDDVKVDLPVAIQLLLNMDLSLKSIDVERMGLQDVFLSLTGRELRDG